MGFFCENTPADEKCRWQDVVPGRPAKKLRYNKCIQTIIVIVVSC